MRGYSLKRSLLLNDAKVPRLLETRSEILRSSVVHVQLIGGSVGRTDIIQLCSEK